MQLWVKQELETQSKLIYFSFQANVVNFFV